MILSSSLLLIISFLGVFLIIPLIGDSLFGFSLIGVLLVSFSYFLLGDISLPINSIETSLFGINFILFILSLNFLSISSLFVIPVLLFLSFLIYLGVKPSSFSLPDNSILTTFLDKNKFSFLNIFSGNFFGSDFLFSSSIFLFFLSYLGASIGLWTNFSVLLFLVLLSYLGTKGFSSSFSSLLLSVSLSSKSKIASSFSFDNLLFLLMILNI